MQNPTSPAVKLQIAGSSFDLVFDFEAIADAEEITGRALLTGLRRRDIECPAINLVDRWEDGSRISCTSVHVLFQYKDC